MWPSFKVYIDDFDLKDPCATFIVQMSVKTFESFKQEIFERMSHLKNKELKYYYTDLEGDRITIFNTSDFRIFCDSPTRKIFVVVKPSKAVPSNKLPKDINGSSLTITCRHCSQQIYGMRYRCMVCVNYYLCMRCGSKNIHNQHTMYRTADPKQALAEMLQSKAEYLNEPGPSFRPTSSTLTASNVPSTSTGIEHYNNISSLFFKRYFAPGNVGMPPMPSMIPPMPPPPPPKRFCANDNNDSLRRTYNNVYQAASSDAISNSLQGLLNQLNSTAAQVNNLLAANSDGISANRSEPVQIDDADTNTDNGVEIVPKTEPLTNDEDTSTDELFLIDDTDIDSDIEILSLPSGISNRKPKKEPSADE